MKMLSKIKTAYELFIKKQYQKIRIKEDFLLKEKQVNVKKGNRRYTLLCYETKNGNLRFNLGRYKEQSEVRELAS